MKMGALLSKAWLTVLFACVSAAAVISLIFIVARDSPTVSGLATNADYVTGEQYGKADSMLFNTGEKGFRRTAHLANGRFPWTIDDDKLSVDSESSAWTGIYHDGERMTDYTVSVNTTIVKIGLISEYPKYGVYAYYSDGDNFVVGMIDPNHGLFTSYYRIDGTDGSWVNSPVAFVDMAAENEIKAIRIGDEIRFYVNGVQVQKRNVAGMSDGYGGLIVEDMQADYTAFSVTPATGFDPVKIPELAQGWGFAQNGVPNGGGFEIKSAQNLVLNSLDTMWPSIWYGDQLSKSYQFTVFVRELERAKEVDYPKYGVYAGFEDNENYVAVFLDAKNQVAASYGMLHGKPMEWQNTGISIDPSKYQELKVIRNGSTFAFYLNGELMHTREVNIGPSQPGLVAEGTRTEYDKFTLGAYGGFDGVVTETSNGWGKASNGTLATAGMQAVSEQKVVGTVLGKDWGRIWLSGSKSTAYDLSFTASSQQVGSTSDFPKYGVYAVYVDEENYLRVMIDPVNSVLTTGGVRGGEDVGWENTKISYDFTKPLPLRVIRSGSTFSIYAGGELAQTRTLDFGAGDVGIVTEDSKSTFDSIVFTKQ